MVIWCLVHASFLQRITGCTTVLSFPILCSLCMTVYKMVKHILFIPVASYYYECYVNYGFKLRGLSNYSKNVGDGGGHITCMVLCFFLLFQYQSHAESSLISSFEECIAFFIHACNLRLALKSTLKNLQQETLFFCQRK